MDMHLQLSSSCSLLWVWALVNKLKLKLRVGIRRIPIHQDKYGAEVEAQGEDFTEDGLEADLLTAKSETSTKDGVMMVIANPQMP